MSYKQWHDDQAYGELMMRREEQRKKLKDAIVAAAIHHVQNREPGTLTTLKTSVRALTEFDNQAPEPPR